MKAGSDVRERVLGNGNGNSFRASGRLVPPVDLRVMCDPRPLVASIAEPGQRIPGPALANGKEVLNILGKFFGALHTGLLAGDEERTSLPLKPKVLVQPLGIEVGPELIDRLF